MGLYLGNTPVTIYSGGQLTAPEEETREVTASTETFEFFPSASGKVISKVTVNPTPSESKEITAGSSDTTVSPTNGKLLSSVTVHPTPSETKTVVPSTEQQIITPSSGKLLSSVTIEGDADFISENIKSGVNIFGIDGTLEGEGLYVWKKYEYNPIITFNINEVPYQAEEDMTWRQWIASSYNTDGYKISSDGKVENYSGTRYVCKAASLVNPDDTIVPNWKYSTPSHSGGGAI